MPEFNEAFWRWFGDSKVVDDQGNPMRVYHWTEENFSSFRLPKTGVIWFCDDPTAYASQYAGGRAYPVFLRVENPVEISGATSEYDLETWEKILQEAEVETDRLVWDSALETDKEYPFGYLFSNWDVRLNDDSNLVEVIKASGFDGVHAPPEDWREPHTSWVVFDPRQIKSVYNRGTWDPSDPDITHNPFEEPDPAWDAYEKACLEYQRGRRKNPPVRPDASIVSDPGYLYHATNEERMVDIAVEGMKPHRPWEFTDQEAWPDGSTEKRVYFSMNAGTVWHFAPEEGEPVILRVPMSSVAWRREAGTGDVYVTKRIPARDVQVLWDDGWRSLQEIRENP